MGLSDFYYSGFVLNVSFLSTSTPIKCVISVGQMLESFWFFQSGDLSLNGQEHFHCILCIFISGFRCPTSRMPGIAKIMALK